MLRNSISAISFALLLVLVSFTGCMDDSDDDSTTTVEQPDTSNDDNTNANQTQNPADDETPDVYDGQFSLS